VNTSAKLIPERDNPGRRDGRVHPVAVRHLVQLGPRLEVFQFFISEIAHKSVSGQGANGYQQEGLLVAKARFSTILRHTNIATNKVVGLG
jgi:hypothetical protein